MKRFVYAACAILWAVGMGCALTDYPTITDKDGGEPLPGHIVNTNGKAHVKEFTILYAVQTGEGWTSLHWFVDQQANGNRTITTKLAGPYADAELAMVDEKYCTPDFNSCAVWTAHDPPGSGFGNGLPFDCAFDGEGHPQCEGFSSLLSLYCGQRYYGECGRDTLDTGDMLQIANMGRFGASMGMEGLFLDYNAKNLTLVIDNNAGYVGTIPVRGSAVSFYAPKNHTGWFDITNPLIGSSGRAYADFLANHETGSMTATLIYNGIGKTMHFKAVGGASKVLKAVNKSF